MGVLFLVVGSGFSGAVLSHTLANKLDCSIDVWDERDHIAGNCFTQRDEQTQVMVHQYGPHIFNTDNKAIWDYVNSFDELMPYTHRVKAKSKGSVYSFPVNLHTINQFFGKSLTPAEAQQLLEKLSDKSIAQPQNFEEQALRFIGRELYEAFFYGYTKKQWGCEPTDLPASILKRIPVRFSYNDNYHHHLYTGIPRNGYSAIIQKMMDHPAIQVSLGKKFTQETDTSQYDHVFFTGPLDAYFNYKFGRLGYRTLSFEKGYAAGDYQGTAQVNYCDLDIPYTRITEHQHFAQWEKSNGTVYFKEYSKDCGPGDAPYYPKRLKDDMALLKLYRQEAEKNTRVSFLGRLATYRYMDMHHVIKEALDFANNFIEATNNSTPPPVFANRESYE